VHIRPHSTPRDSLTLPGHRGFTFQFHYLPPFSIALAELLQPADNLALAGSHILNLVICFLAAYDTFSQAGRHWFNEKNSSLYMYEI